MRCGQDGSVTQPQVRDDHRGPEDLEQVVQLISDVPGGPAQRADQHVADLVQPEIEDVCRGFAAQVRGPQCSGPHQLG